MRYFFVHLSVSVYLEVDIGDFLGVRRVEVLRLSPSVGVNEFKCSNDKNFLCLLVHIILPIAFHNIYLPL